MKRKISMLRQYVKENNFACTIMIINNLLEVHYLKVPCHVPVLEQATVFCMQREENFYGNQSEFIRNKSFTSTIASYEETNRVVITKVFICNDNTSISAFYVCDRRNHCTEHEDEKYCDHFYNLLSPSHLCAGIFSIINSSFDWTSTFSKRKKYNFGLEPKATNYEFDIISTNLFETLCTFGNTTDSCNKISNQVDDFYSLNKYTFDFISSRSAMSNLNMSLNRKYCIYEPNNCFLMSHYGKHLTECEAHICPSKYLKCPGSYCLPWRFVCNGEWDCPGGKDEVLCKRSTCPGMFKCINSSICLHRDNVCDSTSDCVNSNDDERYCFEVDECPLNCSCLVFSLHCQNITVEMKTNLTFYAVIYLEGMLLTQKQAWLHVFGDPLFLVLKNAEIVAICKQFKTFTNLKYFDVSTNHVSILKGNCFRKMSNISYLNMKQNKIRLIAKSAFLESKQISHLDLSENLLSHLNEKIFLGLSSLKVLNLLENPVLSVNALTFFGMDAETIMTSSYMICCLKPSINTMCPAKPIWPNSCKRLLGVILVKIFIWIISFLGMVLNIISYIVIRQKLVESADSYNTVVICFSLVSFY